ncbi:FIMAH domain-containing protein [Paenibacillus dakarensis]|uniref:FIMAH domain-containing protein n=1 Tax=Paenibacillus dakarensis TaxID=1527293 RepID=UPI0006D5307B|nr:Ig-like domain-containing protein [Paenibacillus dakarensis]
MKLKNVSVTLLALSVALPGISAGSAPVRAEGEFVSLQVPNSGFEESASYPIPGWKVTPALPADGLEVAITREQFAEGLQSVRIADNNSTKSLDVASSLVPVEAGGMYRASAKVMVESKSIRAYLRFKDSSGRIIGTPLTQLLELKNGSGWQDMSMEGTAPSGAVSAEIAFYMGGAGTGTAAYVDGVKLEHKPVKAEEPLELPYEDKSVLVDAKVEYALSQSALYGTLPDGSVEQYVATTGSPVSFHVVDAVTGELKFTQPIPTSSMVIWGMAQGTDGNVYFATNGVLYRYMVKEKRIEELGMNPSSPDVFDLKASRDGKIYGSTYSNNKLGRIFEYDIASGQFRDLGIIKEGQQYVRGIGVTDQYIYAGIGTEAHLMKYNRANGEITEIEIPGVTGTTTTLSEVDIYNGKLFVYNGSKLYVLDEETGNFIRTIEFQTKISPPSPHQPDLIYYKLKGDLYSYNMKTDEITRIEGIAELPDDTAVKTHAWITPDKGSFQGKQVLAGMAAFGESFLYDPVTNSYEEHAADLPASPTQINVLETDGKYLHMGGYQRGMSVYDIEKGEMVYSNKQFHQPEGIGFLGDAAYYGTYSSARMYRLDMSKPLEYSEFGQTNPGLAADLEEEQDRPFVITSGEGKLFVGTFPGYGQLGGALTIMEEKPAGEGEFPEVTYETYRNVVKDQSVFGLAYHDGKIYGGTSLNGGLGVEPTADEARMFVFDLETRQVTHTFVPQVEGLRGKARQIGGLSIGPDGLLWGIMDGTVDQSKYDAIIFAMNPETLEVVKSKVITETPFNTSKFRPYYLRWSEDGLLYTTIGRKLIAIDPEDLRSKQLVTGTVNLMTLGEDGSIYYTDNAKLYKLPVKVQKAVLQSDINELLPGQSVQLKPEVELKNGRKAVLEGAKISYTSASRDIAEVDGSGKVTAINPGTTTIQAQITLDGRQIETEPFTITINKDGDWVSSHIKNLLVTYKASADLDHSLASVLNNKIEAAIDHFKDGKRSQALKMVDDYLKHLEKNANSTKISAPALTELTAEGEALKKIWSGESQAR